MIFLFEEVPIDYHCIICGTGDVGGMEKMRIMRKSGENLISFTVCEECRLKMLEELESHNEI